MQVLQGVPTRITLMQIIAQYFYPRIFIAVGVFTSFRFFALVKFYSNKSKQSAVPLLSYELIF